MAIGTNNPGHNPSNTSHYPANSRFKMMTQEQFEQWLDTVDMNHDGYISQNELYAALATLGLHFKTWKAWWAMRRCDKNHNNVIDKGFERKKLIDYAQKHWHIIVTN